MFTRETERCGVELYRTTGAKRIGFMSRINITPIRYEKGSGTQVIRYNVNKAGAKASVAII